MQNCRCIAGTKKKSLGTLVEMGIYITWRSALLLENWIRNLTAEWRRKTMFAFWNGHTLRLKHCPHIFRWAWLPQAREQKWPKCGFQATCSSLLGRSATTLQFTHTSWMGQPGWVCQATCLNVKVTCGPCITFWPPLLCFTMSLNTSCGSLRQMNMHYWDLGEWGGWYQLFPSSFSSRHVKLCHISLPNNIKLTIKPFNNSWVWNAYAWC